MDENKSHDQGIGLCMLSRRSFCDANEDLLVVGGRCIEHCMRLLDKLSNSKQRGDLALVVDRLDQVSNNLCSIIDYSGAVYRLHLDRRARDNALATVGKVSGLMAQLNGDIGLYKTLKKSLLANKDEQFLCKEGQKVGTSLLADFEDYGINLSPGARKTFAKLQIDIQNIGHEFEDSLQEPLQSSMVSLSQLVCRRAEAAKLLGHSSYAHLFLKDKVLTDPKNVLNFLNTFDKPQNSNIAEHPEVHSGLCFESILKVLAYLSHNLFETKFVANAEGLWGHDSVRLCFSSTLDDSPMGTVYFIISQRNSVTCHFPIRTWRMRPAENTVYGTNDVQTPICVVTVEVADKMNLSFSEIQSIFHEFGHALHTICAKTMFHHLSGTRCKLDFAEVPSNLMEIILQDSRIFSILAPTRKFVESHQRWVADIVCREDNNNSSQAQLAKFDQFVHGLSHRDCNSPEVFAHQVRHWCSKNTKSPTESFNLLNQVCKFRHLVSYGAGYYSYLFNQRIAKDIWKQYLDPNSPSYEPQRFLKDALRYGGTRDTSDILDSLNIEID
ncbi:hypothetical protein PSACC_00301 [Paramicrosporidium saccamoebae]|uniref:Peptidase M3A/M3B catalytic domain-containing protein n=1 Tax=Paramicrosporidium saccamoebae TaxID=1246581 RepID=A0A2H9TQ66_9FUNG|nr:hypothetical protein PSACC_00301 [Paramicrosporidium saccamoebae]